MQSTETSLDVLAARQALTPGLDTLAAPPTLESLEAGLLTLAHGLGREHAMRVRRAMNGVKQANATPAVPCTPAATEPSTAFGANCLDLEGA